MTTTPKFIRDTAGKKAYVRSSVQECSEFIGQDAGYDLYVHLRTGRYYAVASR